eukprot:gene18495-20346_t
MSYREACLARGLLEDDNNLYLAMEKASVSQSPPSLQVLFAVILTTCFPSEARKIWDQFRQTMSEEYLFVHRRNVSDPTADFNEQIYNVALCNLEDRVIMMGGDTGKSFLVNTILKKIRSRGNIALATASSGIASTLLDGGRTLHSIFKIPLDTHMKNQPMCGVKRGTELAKVIKDTALIVVDEAPMTHKSAYEALNSTLQDITGINTSMGGIPTLLCRDFRQILPAVKRGTRANIVNASLKTSDIWGNVTVKHLTTNMHAQTLGEEGANSFSELLLQIGEGRIPMEEAPATIIIPDSIGKSFATQEELKEEIYPSLQVNGTSSKWLAERAILSLLNTNVNSLNNCFMREFPVEERLYRSVDSAICDE